jgi:peptidoglycan/LPS O-acetylase OafA/YrhL
MVVACHYLAIFDNTEILMPFAWLWTLAWTGVDLFFVLSGFLIGGILLDQQRSENFFKVFFTRRVCRIFPLYFFWLALFFILPAIWPWLRSEEPISGCFERVIPSWSYFTFFQNFFAAKISHVDNDWMGVTWSLAVEEQFYFTLPFLGRFLPRRFLPWTLISIALIAPALRLFSYIVYPAGEIAAYVLLPCRADSLIAGVLCAYALRSEKLRGYLTPSLLRVSGTVLFIGIVFLWWNGCWQHSFEMVSWGYSWLALFFSCILLIIVTTPRHSLGQVMRFYPLRKLGEISFGIYLFHVPINALWHGLWLGRDIYIHNAIDALASSCALASTLLLAWCSWKFFEKPVVDFSHRFKYTKAEATKASPVPLTAP